MRKFFSKISFHPYLAAVLDFLAGLVFVFSGFYLLFNWWVVALWLLVRALWWGALIFLTFYPPDFKKINHLLALLVFNLGVSLLLLFSEWSPAKILLGIILIVGSSLSFCLIPLHKQGLSFLVKPERRLLLVLTLLGILGLWVGINAIIIFEYRFIPKFWLILMASAITTAVSAWWWSMYGLKFNRELKIWTAAIGLIVLEIAWSLSTTSVGHIVFGVVIAWIWYLLWLMVRFHLSSGGINWKKQAPTLITNGLLFLIFMVFLVKWN